MMPREFVEVPQSAAPDPVLVAQWQVEKLVNRWRKIDESKNPGEWQAADQAWRDAEARMIDTSAMSLAGVIAKLNLAIELMVGRDLETAVIAAAIADLERLAKA